MKYIKNPDKLWHDPKKELPPCSTDVYFMYPDGKVCKGEIVVEPCGFFAYIRDTDYRGWENLDMLKWKFRKNY